MIGKLQINLFGRLNLAYEGQPWALRAPPRTVPLLAYLLLKPNTLNVRNAVAQAIWPDVSDSEARTNLRRHVHYLNQSLPKPATNMPWLCVTPTTLRWNTAAPYLLDVAEFERECKLADRSNAVERYTGDLLEDVDEEWLVYDRERLRNTQAAVLTELIEVHRQSGNLAAALTAAQRLLLHDTWREDALRAVMALRFALGDRAGAVAEYERFAQRLSAELGVLPMLESSNLAAALIASPSASPSCAVLEPVGHRVPENRRVELPFVGRDSERERLYETWERARRGRGAVVIVGGEAGIGKSRLVSAFAHDAGPEPRLLRGATSAPEAIPYQALSAALDSAGDDLEKLPIDDVWLDALSAIVPRLRRRQFAPQAPRLGDASREERRLIEAAIRVFAALARSVPTIVVLEDIHWAGTATIGMLDELAQRCSDVPLLVIATYREEDVHRGHSFRGFRRRLVRESPGSHLALSALDRPAVTALFERIAQRAVPQTFIDDLHARSEGNPFFIAELFRDATERGDVDVAGGRWTLDATRRDCATPNITDVIVERLERLSARALTAAEIGAVIGDAFDVDVLAEAAGWSRSQTLDAVDELLDRRIVRESGIPTVDYAFSHHLLAASTYAHAAPAETARRHRRIARILADVSADRADELAHQLADHYFRGGDLEKAADSYVRAAMRALRLFATDEAADCAARAIDARPSAQTLVSALLVSEEIARRRGNRDAQAACIMKLDLLSGTSGEDMREIERRRIALAHVRGETVLERTAIERLRTLARHAPTPWRAIAELADGERLVAAGELDAARATFECALTHADDSTSLLVRFEIFRGLADVAVHQADGAAALGFLQCADELAESANDDYLRFRALYERYAFVRDRENGPTVLALARDVLERARRIGDVQAEMFAHLRLAYAALYVFDICEARENIEYSATLATATANPKERFGIVTIKGMLALAVGDVELAGALFASAHHIATANDDRYSRLVSEINLTCAACAAGEAVSALERSAPLVAAARALNAPYLEAGALGARGAALRLAGRPHEACTILECCIEIYRELKMDAAAGQDLAELGIAYIESGNATCAVPLVEQLAASAASADAGSSNPHFMLWSAARIARAIGNDRRSLELSECAYELYRRLRAKIPDERSRICFSQTSFARQIVTAHEERAGPKILA